ncbi:MAG TPA: TonB-dependent receptor [Verrucomicrobiae bacterium]|nr:TonB-dependent receptor [Verrucomicrobiae bacterium]
MLCVAPAALAGTTGALYGVVVDVDATAPVAGATVTASGPSGTATATTDAAGHFALVSLAPDEYTVTVTKAGFTTTAQTGIVVFADEQQTLWLEVHEAGHAGAPASSTARSAGSNSLVHPGATADMYSVTPAAQQRASILGGGGDLNSAYSAIALAPGAYVPFNQSGYLQAVHVRGGDSDQVGYELDGVPLNRGFDNYPSSSISSLGQLELQIYTGATPANAEAQGLAGFINQVVKTGTSPGYASADLGAGTPTFYHSVVAEAGGSTPDRLFSYYVGLSGFNQDHRYVDQFGGAAYANEFGPVLDGCPAHPPANLPSCFENGQPALGPSGEPGYILGPIAFASIEPANVAVRSSIVNLHFGIPHRNDSGRDDLQLLYDNDQIYSSIFSSIGDEGLNNFQGTSYPRGTLPYYLDTWQYTGALGSTLPSNYASLVTPYYFPSSPSNRPFDGTIAPDTRDVGTNEQAVAKLQYQKNFSSNAYLRVYGYTYYSNYITTGAISSWQPYTGYESGDYELSSHARGVSATFADQLDARNLLLAQASYTTANALTVYNEQMFGYADSFAVLVDSRAQTSGVCYAIPSTGTVATPTTCNDGQVLPIGLSATFASLAAIGEWKMHPTAAPPIPNAAAYTCGGAPCAFYVAENGADGEYNGVRPNFSAASITDEFKPSDRWTINLGLRADRYVYVGSDTDTGPARNFWFDAFNADTCYDPSSYTLYDKSTLVDPATGKVLAMTDPCSLAGKAYQPADLQNESGQQYAYDILQPRLSAAYTASPDTVLRASYGKYNEQPSTQYEQYDSLQQNLTDTLVPFYQYGFNTPGHEVEPSISYNADLSLEHRFRGTGLSFKLTPFYRQTKNQVESFYVSVKADITSGINAGSQTSRGFELALDDGDFSQNGFAGSLAFAYTNSYVRYSTLPNGSTVIAPVNAAIQQYNAYTSACALHPSKNPSSPCYTGIGQTADTSNHLTAGPCYTPAGVPQATCAGNDIANPYWNAPPQGLFDPNGEYLPYSNFPAGIGTSANSFIYPYVATLMLNYKHNRFAATPSVQFVAGNRYGAPETTPGIDPAAGCKALPGTTQLDPGRYPYGGAGGLPYNADSCAGSLAAIPDPYTGNFDGIGAFREPAQLLVNLQLSYDITPRVSATLAMANLVNTCFGMQKTPFTYFVSSNVCSYGGLVNGLAPVGNMYNPAQASSIQTFLRYPYEPSFGSYNDLSGSLVQPFNLYFNLKVKI